LQVALNGARTSAEHQAVPLTPRALACEARTSVEAGAQVLHIHAYDESGRETLAAVPCAAAVRAIRAACPGVPISLTTSATIEPDSRRRLEFVESWTELPDLVTANQGEDGILSVCELLLAHGVGIEAGLLCPRDARSFVQSGLADRCVRVMIEPLCPDADRAIAEAAEMEDTVFSAGITLEQVHHGEGLASWAVNARGLRRGHGIRTGLEDTTVLPDGTVAPDNAALVRAAAEMIRRLR
jgi:uncharacterized protein (DUF849 family)